MDLLENVDPQPAWRLPLHDLLGVDSNLEPQFRWLKMAAAPKRTEETRRATPNSVFLPTYLLAIENNFWVSKAEVRCWQCYFFS